MAEAMDVADDAGEFVGDDAQNDAELTEQPVVETTRSKRRVRPPQTLVESIAATKPRRKRKATPKVAGMRGGGKSEGSSGRSRISSSRDVTSYVSALDATGDGSGVKALGAKHRAVKRKFNALVFESNEIMDCLERHARNNVRLLEQRKYVSMESRSTSLKSIYRQRMISVLEIEGREEECGEGRGVLVDGRSGRREE